MKPFNYTQNASAVPQYYDLVTIPDLMGDIVVIKPDNCTGAASTNWTETSIGPTILGHNLDAYDFPIQDAMEIFANMTIPGRMVVCFAVRETGGLLDEDYVMLTDWGLTTPTVINRGITQDAVGIINTRFLTTDRTDTIINYSDGPRNWILGTTV
jgi:hypothetical protein